MIWSTFYCSQCLSLCSADGLESDSNDESTQEIDIEKWSKSPEIIGCFKCQEIKDDGYMLPRSVIWSVLNSSQTILFLCLLSAIYWSIILSIFIINSRIYCFYFHFIYICLSICGNSYLGLSNSHLFVLREVSPNKSLARIVAKRPLEMIVQITSKRRCPDLITFKYGHNNEGTEPTVVAKDHLLIPKPYDVTRLIKQQVIRILDGETSSGSTSSSKASMIWKLFKQKLFIN